MTFLSHKLRILRAMVSMMLFATIVFFGMPVNAQEGLSVTLTPPLFQLAIGPGETWTSSLKVVNNNAYDVTYYTQVVDMQANGETGLSKFIPIMGPPDPALANAQLAQWLQVDSEPFTIKAGQSSNVRFTVSIPQSAEPGGHYAAILVGTQPPAPDKIGSQMNIAALVSSLIFVRVKGDVIESGRIRELTADKSLYQEPKADFLLRFENTGNTHLKPEGDVTIYNMWGKKRGEVQINQKSDFGNVLPQTIRRFQFSWEGETDVFDIGRYSAVVTLAYGEDGRKNITATTYFWVIPLVPVSIAFGIIVSSMLVFAWFIRRYIRRALELERMRYGVVPTEPVAAQRAPILETIVEPLKEGVVDLRALRNGAQKVPPDSVYDIEMPISPISRLTLTQFTKKYRLFFVFVIIVMVCVIGLWIYFDKVLVAQKAFNITPTPSQSEQVEQ